MSTFHAQRQLDRKFETTIKRIQLIGFFSESVLLAIGIVLFFLDYQIFALFLALMALGGLFVFLKIIPDNMRKKIETLQTIQPFIEMDNQKIRHGKIKIPWEQVSAVLRANPEHISNEHSPIQSSDTVYILSTQEQTSNNLSYSSFFQSYGGHPYLRLNISYFEKPETFLKELEQIIREKNISFLETTDARKAEKFFQETYKNKR